MSRTLFLALSLSSFGILRAADSLDALKKALDGLAPGATVSVVDGTYTTTKGLKWEQASSAAIDGGPKLLRPQNVGPDAQN